MIDGYKIGRAIWYFLCCSGFIAVVYYVSVWLERMDPTR